MKIRLVLYASLSALAGFLTGYLFVDAFLQRHAFRTLPFRILVSPGMASWEALFPETINGRETLTYAFNGMFFCLLFLMVFLLSATAFPKSIDRNLCIRVGLFASLCLAIVCLGLSVNSTHPCNVPCPPPGDCLCTSVDQITFMTYPVIDGVWWAFSATFLYMWVRQKNSAA